MYPHRRPLQACSSALPTTKSKFNKTTSLSSFNNQLRSPILMIGGGGVCRGLGAATPMRLLSSSSSSSGGGGGFYTPSHEGGSDGDNTSAIWEDGSPGYEWKQRLLREKRETAMQFMFDIGKRQPIHDAVRLRSKMNRDRLMRHTSTSVEDGSFSASDMLSESIHLSRTKPDHIDLADDDARQWDNDLGGSGGREVGAATDGGGGGDHLEAELDRMIDDLVSDEGVLDTLKHIPDEELDILSNEFQQASSTTSYLGQGDPAPSSPDPKEREAQLLRAWFNMRKQSSAYQSYCAVPEGERNEWSAWYLRHVVGSGSGSGGGGGSGADEGPSYK